MRRVFLVLALLTTVAHAAPDKRAHALELAAESERAYKDGKFEKAADLLRKAHDTYPEPILLYNLGRALEGMGDQKGAVDAYEQYLRDAKKIDDRPAIERRVATLKAQIEKDKQDAADQAEKDRIAKEQAEQTEKDRLAKEQAAQQQPTPPTPPTPPPHQDPLPPPPPPAGDDDNAFERIGPWATIGAGGALVVTGALFGWRANANHDAAVSAMKQTDASDLQNTATTDASIANVTLVVGGAALVGGAIWEYFAWKRGTQAKEPVSRARLHVAPTGVALEWKLP